MPHSRFLPAVAVLSALAVAAPAAAQFRPYVAIEKARVGFRPGQFSNEQDAFGSVALAKKGQWAPISFELKVLRKRDPADPPLQMKLRVEGRDADETRYTAYFPLGTPLNGFTPPPTDPTGTDTTAPVNWVVQAADLPKRACARPGGDTGTITLTVVSDIPGERADDLSDPVKLDGSRLRDPNSYFVVSLGSTLPGFDLSDPNDRGFGQPQPRGNRGGLRGGRVETGVIDSVAELPDQWFAYDAADLVVLSTATSGQGFLEQLFDPQAAGPNSVGERKREALLEWVRRGGKLVVCVGREADRLKQYPAFAGTPTSLVPIRLTGRAETTRRDLTYPSSANSPITVTTRMSWTRIDTVKLKVMENGKEVEKDEKREVPNAPFPVAVLEPLPGRVTLPLLREAGTGRADGPLILAQCPLGLGRISVVGFDLDSVPFATLDKPARQSVWDWLVRAAGSERAAEPQEKNQNNVLSPVSVEDGALAAIRRHVDEFEGVPVISFGWVALFILLYTILIGPVEYLFLKKILGRLELTWITFPIIVLSVSAAAYFTAYAIKGKDLRINKIDVVDIDLGSRRVYGRAWFTVFSPRVDSYTVGIEPKAPWAGEPDYKAAVPPSMVDWVGGNRVGSGGAGGFRTYRYELDGSGGLVSVPIQVWSTKTFSANWSAPFDPATPPVTATIRHPAASATAAAGEITANIPFGNFQEGFVFFAGEAYPLKPLPVGQPVRFDSTNAVEQNWESKVTLFDGKFRVDDSSNEAFRGNRPVQGQATAAGPLSLWGVLIGDRALRQSTASSQNASLRALDQSWRLSKDNREEVIIIAKLAREPKPAPPGPPKPDAPPPPTAEELMTDPNSTSPTKLWLRGLPGSGRVREPVPGLLTQETYVRIYIPVLPAGGAK